MKPKNIFHKVKAKIKYLAYAPSLMVGAFLLSYLTLPAYADAIGDSSVAKGLKTMIGDMSKTLLIIAPIAMVAFIIYFFIRKGMADELDQKKWNSRIITALISGVGAMVASGILTVVLNYFT